MKEGIKRMLITICMGCSNNAVFNDVKLKLKVSSIELYYMHAVEI